MTVARAFLSLMPLSCRKSRAFFSLSEQLVQTNRFSLGFTVAVFGSGLVPVSNSLIIEKGGAATGGGGNTEKGRTPGIATEAKRGTVTLVK